MITHYLITHVSLDLLTDVQIIIEGQMRHYTLLLLLASIMASATSTNSDNTAPAATVSQADNSETIAERSIFTSDNEAEAEAAAVGIPKSSNSPPGLEWMHGRSNLVISMVFAGRLDVNDLPPLGQDHLLYPQFEDVVFANMQAVALGSDEENTMTYHDVYGRAKTEEEHETYLQNEKALEKPFKGQLAYLCKDANCCESGVGERRWRGREEGSLGRTL